MLVPASRTHGPQTDDPRRVPARRGVRPAPRRAAPGAGRRAAGAAPREVRRVPHPRRRADEGGERSRSRSPPGPASRPARGCLIGRYLILSLIGRGGMGEVHAAVRPGAGSARGPQAPATARSSEGARKRLLREARALGKLSHPNVVQVYDVGEHEGDVFVAMELVEGAGVRRLVPRRPAPALAGRARGVPRRRPGPARGARQGPRPSRRQAGEHPARRGRPRARRRLRPRRGARAADRRRRSPACRRRPRPWRRARPRSRDETLPVPSAARSGGEEPLTRRGDPGHAALHGARAAHRGRARPRRPISTASASRSTRACTARRPSPSARTPASGSKIMARKKAGPPAAPPSPSPVPAWVHRALVRGLAPRPEDRYPSMPALIAAMSTDPDLDPPGADHRARPDEREPLAEPAGRVPRPLTPLVGRAVELSEITSRVRATRLVTLTGTGGIGKSRLALQAAAYLAGEFAGGAWFVESAPLADRELVVPTVASVLGVHDAPGRPPFDVLVASLRSRRVLLVLDNCEHVLDAATSFVDVGSTPVPNLHVLATSRELLGLPGEHAFRVPSLVAAEAVALFQERRRQAEGHDAAAEWPRFASGSTASRSPSSSPRRGRGCSLGRADCGAARRLLPPAHRRQPRGAPPPPHAEGGRRLGLPAPHRRGAGAAAPPLRLRRRLLIGTKPSAKHFFVPEAGGTKPSANILFRKPAARSLPRIFCSRSRRHEAFCEIFRSRRHEAFREYFVPEAGGFKPSARSRPGARRFQTFGFQIDFFPPGAKLSAISRTCSAPSRGPPRVFRPRAALPGARRGALTPVESVR